VHEFGFRSEDVQEIFLYISDSNGFFRYREWLLEQNINLKILLDGPVRAPSSISGGDTQHVVSGRNNTSTLIGNPIDQSMNESRISGSMAQSQHFLPPPVSSYNEDSRLRK
jgi:hypothetical protein